MSTAETPPEDPAEAESDPDLATLPTRPPPSSSGAVVALPDRSATADADRLFTGPFVRILGTQAAYGFAMSVYLLLPKSLAQAGGTPSQIGQVMAAFGAASVLTIPFLGRIIGGLGRRRALMVASVVMALTSLGFALSPGPGVGAVVLRAVQGVSWALMFSAGISLAAELAPPARLAQAIGFAGGASLAMSAVAPAVGEPLVAAFGYRPLYLLAAAVALIGVVLARRLPLRKVARPPLPTVSAPSGASGVAPTRDSSRRLSVYVALGIGGFAYMVLFTFLGPFALEHGVTAIRAFFVAYTVAALAIRILAGRLFDRLGHRSVGVKALTMYGLVVAAAGIIGPGWLTTLGAAFGLAHGAVIPSLMALLLNGAPLDQRPRTLGIANAAMSLGIAAVYPAGGLVGRLGYPAVFLATGALTACSALLIRGAKAPSAGAVK